MIFIPLVGLLSLWGCNIKATFILPLADSKSIVTISLPSKGNHIQKKKLIIFACVVPVNTLLKNTLWK